jgi:hypothetical protein
MVLALLLLAVTHTLDAGDTTSELAVSFAVPAVVTPSENGACRLTPSFERLEATPSVLQSLFSDSTTREAEVITIASSSDEKVVRGVSIASEDFWQVATGPASCLSQCIRLPLEATLTELTLTYSNGRVPCLVKPIDGRVTPTLIGIVSGLRVAGSAGAARFANPGVRYGDKLQRPAPSNPASSAITVSARSPGLVS